MTVLQHGGHDKEADDEQEHNDEQAQQRADAAPFVLVVGQFVRHQHDNQAYQGGEQDGEQERPAEADVPARAQQPDQHGKHRVAAQQRKKQCDNHTS